MRVSVVSPITGRDALLEHCNHLGNGGVHGVNSRVDASSLMPFGFFICTRQYIPLSHSEGEYVFVPVAFYV